MCSLLRVGSVRILSMGLFHIHTNRSINTRKHPTPTPLGKVYKRALVVPSSTPHQIVFVCGACKCTTQVVISLVSLLDPLFKQSRLHCLDVFAVIFVTHKSTMTIPTLPMWTPSWYATIPDLLCVHHYSAVPVLPKIWWWCINNSPGSGTWVHMVSV